MMTRKEILNTAVSCVCGAREEQYGPPEDNFNRIALYWTLHLGLDADTALTAQDVAIMMMLLKIARAETGVGSDDTFVDIAGYAACAGEIAGRLRECRST